MSAGHTPGPWHVDANNCHAGQVAVCHGDDSGYAEVWSANWVMENHRSQFANARLIAAAPDLLSALKYLVANQEVTWRHAGFTEAQIKETPYLKASREAIDKATGGAA